MAPRTTLTIDASRAARRRPSTASSPSLSPTQTHAPTRAGQLSIIDRRVKRLAAAGRTPLSPVEMEITKEFVHEDHFRAIAIAAKVGNFAVTFRLSGDATLDCIATGAPCKGHDLLEKTIKSSSLAKVYPDAGPELLAAIEDAGILGRVGHWSDGRLLGLHVSAEVHDVVNSDDPARRAFAERLQDTPDRKHRYYPIDTDDLTTSLAALKAVAGWETLIPSGDYDIHDMIDCNTQPAPVPSDSAEERHVIDAINVAVSAADERRPVDQPHLHTVQHGPQQSYVAHMLNEERGQPLIGTVAGLDLPLALCDRGEWRILSTLEDLEAFYNGHGAHLKVTWKPDSPDPSRRSTLYLEELPAGRGRLTRRPSAVDVAK